MQPIDVFLRNCLSGLRRISGASRGDLSIEDVKGEAWVMAHELALAGKPLDLTSPVGQDAFLRKLYGKLILSMRTAVGFARRLDKGWDQEDDDTGSTLSNMLTADESSDPLRALEMRENLTPLELACIHSYSQATAYAICLDRWKGMDALALYLSIQTCSLEKRIRYWRAWVEYQPSIFDGIERIGLDFMPLRRFPFPALEVIALDGEQYAWCFDTAQA